MKQRLPINEVFNTTYRSRSNLKILNWGRVTSEPGSGARSPYRFLSSAPWTSIKKTQGGIGGPLMIDAHIVYYYLPVNQASNLTWATRKSRSPTLWVLWSVDQVVYWPAIIRNRVNCLTFSLRLAFSFLWISCADEAKQYYLALFARQLGLLSYKLHPYRDTQRLSSFFFSIRLQRHPPTTQFNTSGKVVGNGDMKWCLILRDMEGE